MTSPDSDSLPLQTPPSRLIGVTSVHFPCLVKGSDQNQPTSSCTAGICWWNDLDLMHSRQLTKPTQPLDAKFLVPMIFLNAFCPGSIPNLEKSIGKRRWTWREKKIPDAKNTKSAASFNTLNVPKVLLLTHQ